MSRVDRISFSHPAAFWLGTAAVGAGVLAHLPDFFASAAMGFHMGNMHMSKLMLCGMVLIIGGMALTTYGLVPGADGTTRRRAASGMHVRAMDAARLTRLHWGMMFVLGVALVIDVMKPATLGFVIPGMKGEYGLKGAEVAWLPLIALSGTTLGSLLWGALADRIGRRAAILLASVLFMGTSICGFMPSYAWNLFMCFLMGIAAGGMLPIVYALMAESIPARRRGWLIVLHGGLGAACGYLVAAGLAAWLEPQFTWRMLWFAGLPTGLVLLLLNYWIPESPRYLLEHGRVDDAEAVMRRYGIEVTLASDAVDASQATQPTAPAGGPWSLFQSPYLAHTVTVLAYGLSWGLVNWGFLTFLPTILRDRGLSAVAANRLLFLSALIAVPGTVLVAYLYGLWSSKRSMILFALVTCVALGAFSLVDPAVGGRTGGGGGGLLVILTVLLLLGSGGIISMLSPYTAEIYPTRLRGTASGIAAGSSKLGGIVAPPLAAWILAAWPGFTAIGLIVATPVALSALVLALAGVETRDRGLEELTGAPAGASVELRPSDA